MITQSIIGWILVFLGFSIGIYQIKQEWNKYTSIKDKIIFLDNNSLPRIFVNDNKLNMSKLKIGLIVDDEEQSYLNYNL